MNRFTNDKFISPQVPEVISPHDLKKQTYSEAALGLVFDGAHGALYGTATDVDGSVRVTEGMQEYDGRPMFKTKIYD